MQIFVNEQTRNVSIKIVCHAMKLYLDHKIKANKQYTPSNMLKFASRFTGKSYKRNGLAEAYKDLCKVSEARPPIPLEFD